MKKKLFQIIQFILVLSVLAFCNDTLDLPSILLDLLSSQTVSGKKEVPLVIILKDTLFLEEMGFESSDTDFSGKLLFIWNNIYEKIKKDYYTTNIKMDFRNSLEYEQGNSDRAFLILVYKQYRGNLIFSKINGIDSRYMPVDALKNLYKRYEEENKLVFINKEVEKLFWKSFEYKSQDIVPVPDFLKIE